MEIEPYGSNHLANQINNAANKVNFGKGYDITPILTEETAQDVVEALGGLDYRAKRLIEPGFMPVFLGLAFDPNNVRSQSFALYEKSSGKAVAVSTTVVAPKKWVKEQKYFKKVDGGIMIVGFSEISGPDLPDFLIIPAWTKVKEDLLIKFAIPGFRAFWNIVHLIQNSAPQNTWIEAVAQGQFPFPRRAELKDIAAQNVGTVLKNEDLPFDVELIGKNSLGASSSVKMAKLLGLTETKNIGSAVTLGPSFSKKIK